MGLGSVVPRYMHMLPLTSLKYGMSTWYCSEVTHSAAVNCVPCHFLVWEKGVAAKQLEPTYQEASEVGLGGGGSGCGVCTMVLAMSACCLLCCRSLRQNVTSPSSRTSAMYYLTW